MSPNSLVGSHIDGPPPPALSTHLQATAADEVHDLICVGFGPASLAVAVALHDSMASGATTRPPKVLFLEKQPRFAWHAGMLLPGAKMQISFIKDMATLRDPRSHFTFLNFVHEQRRLIDFINLNTFLPARVEYEEYLRWCAGHFRHVVQYGREVQSVTPVAAGRPGEPVSAFDVTSADAKTGSSTTYRARNVIMAIGGQPSIPRGLPANHPRIIHSSQYAHLVPKILTQSAAPYRVAVIGGGQSGAEIFNNIQKLYPNSRTHLIMRSEFLKPSDDSPFVNSIFNPAFIDDLYPRTADGRSALLKDARSTNYGVVRLELIEALYEHMYEQRRELGPDERLWPHRIHGATEVTGLDNDGTNSEQGPLRLRVRSLRDQADDVLDVDLVIAATGYQRTSHLTMMQKVAPLLPGLQGKQGPLTDRDVQVGRDYGVRFAPGKVAKGSGIWLQGCNEKTHGLSDTLLSVLATRSGEIVESIFGGDNAGPVKAKL
ncbi:L-ornithine 5-monooxygenase [Apiospora kogelbergensis]|uniref:L-ornithine N(5)-monooxygenase [NAD(P)H] n=1 Tax=Apiospora kogelbergensis TaxID=1337665 RepID=A0AAW0R2R0_9PEZI